ncbi:MAG: hypothetical protein NUW37_14485, partial [Planctomycetes bacterium]|nr:hypothetical protein [Planctomycetota bacterium]
LSRKTSIKEAGASCIFQNLPQVLLKSKACPELSWFPLGGKLVNENEISKHNDVNIGYYVVSFMDVLGQHDKLKGWTHLPTDDEERSKFISALKKTIGTVIQYREMFEDVYNSYESETLSEEQLSQLSESQREKYYRALEAPIGFQQFGDTFIHYAPLRNSHGDVTVVPLLKMLMAASALMLTSLAGKAPLRGAIVVGLGMEIEPGKFYGPALAEAHHIESKISEYPRVVLSDEAVNFVKCSGGYSSDTDIERIYSGTSEMCKGLLCEDSDDRVIVDFLGTQVRTLDELPLEDVSQAVKMAHEFVSASTRSLKRRIMKNCLLDTSGCKSTWMLA